MMKNVIVAMGAVALVACNGAKSIDAQDITGKWQIEQAMGKSTEAAEKPAFINFEKNGKMNGDASVNLFHGSYELKGEALKFMNVGSTMMLGRSMDVEDAVKQAMAEAAAVKVQGNKAYIIGEKNDTVMVLAK